MFELSTREAVYFAVKDLCYQYPDSFRVKMKSTKHAYGIDSFAAFEVDNILYGLSYDFSVLKRPANLGYEFPVESSITIREDPFGKYKTLYLNEVPQVLYILKFITLEDEALKHERDEYGLDVESPYYRQDVSSRLDPKNYVLMSDLKNENTVGAEQALSLLHNNHLEFLPTRGQDTTLEDILRKKSVRGSSGLFTFA